MKRAREIGKKGGGASKTKIEGLCRLNKKKPSLRASSARNNAHTFNTTKKRAGMGGGKKTGASAPNRHDCGHPEKKFESRTEGRVRKDGLSTKKDDNKKKDKRGRQSQGNHPPSSIRKKKWGRRGRRNRAI